MNETDKATVERIDDMYEALVDKGYTDPSDFVTALIKVGYFNPPVDWNRTYTMPVAQSTSEAYRGTPSPYTGRTRPRFEHGPA